MLLDEEEKEEDKILMWGRGSCKSKDETQETGWRRFIGGVDQDSNPGCDEEDNQDHAFSCCQKVKEFHMDPL
jgi:hypothetical protein